MSSSSHINHTNKAIFVALGANLLIAISKLIGYFFTMSSAMFSEAVHSFADCFNQILLLIGSKKATKLANHKYQFGHGKEEFLYSFLVAIILFSFGSLFAIYEGVHHIIHPEPIKNVSIVLVTLLFAFIVEGYSLLQALKVKGKNISYLSYIKKTTDSSSVVVLIEDTAALVGLGFTFVAILLAVTVNPIFDGIGALVTGLILGVLSIILALELGKLLKGEGLSQSETFKLKMLINKTKLVQQVNAIQSMVIGRDKFLIIVSVDPFDSDSGLDIENISETIKQLILKEFEEALIFVDFSNLKIK